MHVSAFYRFPVFETCFFLIYPVCAPLCISFLPSLPLISGCSCSSFWFVPDMWRFGPVLSFRLCSFCLVEVWLHFLACSGTTIFQKSCRGHFLALLQPCSRDVSGLWLVSVPAHLSTLQSISAGKLGFQPCRITFCTVIFAYSWWSFTRPVRASQSLLFSNSLRAETATVCRFARLGCVPSHVRFFETLICTTSTFLSTLGLSTPQHSINAHAATCSLTLC